MLVIVVARPEEIEEEKGQMIGQILLRQNNTFSSGEIWKRIFSLRTEVDG